ncbi:unnamed protein product [Rotaria sp. Silwood1]|nr:unnamed protein product [Rotaria sp. Silwood1]
MEEVERFNQSIINHEAFDAFMLESIDTTNNESLSEIHKCSLQARLNTSIFLTFKSIESTYLRVLIGPGILLNLLCLFILSRSKLSNKSTTVIFLRILAFFDILSIIFQYIRAEINYQSTEKGYETLLLTSSACLITAANIVIAVILRRTSYDWRICEDSNKQESGSNFSKTNLSKASLRRNCSGRSTTKAVELVLATKRRTNAQVTRMLLAVTLSLIIFNIPNTIFFVCDKVYDIRQILHGRSCLNISDRDIVLYKFGFCSGVIQDILSDLPHVVNFFLYCLAGKKFRSIFINEFHQLFIDFHLIEQKQRRRKYGTSILNSDLTCRTGYRHNLRYVSSKPPASKL